MINMKNKASNQFAKFIRQYLGEYLPNVIGVSKQTLLTYNYGIQSLVKFFEHQECPVSKIEIQKIDKEVTLRYLNWLESNEGNSVSTRNQRLAILKSFISFAAKKDASLYDNANRIKEIPPKRALLKSISYLKPEGIKLLLEQPNRKTRIGYRDFVILSLLYSTGMRVSELIGLSTTDVSLTHPATITVLGKGYKRRIIPLQKQMTKILKDYMKLENIENDNKNQPLFANRSSLRFTRQGINYIIKKYGTLARNINKNLIPEDISPHKIRHSTGMNLLAEGVDIYYIKDILGHASVETTQIYAKADEKRKREAIKYLEQQIIEDSEVPQWQNNANLKEWLKGFSKGLKH